MTSVHKLQDYQTLSLIRAAEVGTLCAVRIIHGGSTTFKNPTVLKCAVHISSGDRLLFEVDKTNPNVSRWRRDNLNDVAAWTQSKYTNELLEILSDKTYYRAIYPALWGILEEQGGWNEY